MSANYKHLDGETLDNLYEERAAILEYDAGRSRWEAEQLAAQMYGFENKSALKVEVQVRKAKKDAYIEYF